MGDHPWGDPVYKTAKGKIFLFAGEDETGTTAITVKLAPDEGMAALTLPFVSQAAYVGRYGWVTARIHDDASTRSPSRGWRAASNWCRQSGERRGSA